jgi:hypothetical protein
MKEKHTNRAAAPSSIMLYQTEDGRSRIEVRLENETVWLTQQLMAELFQTTQQNISLHVRNVSKIWNPRPRRWRQSGRDLPPSGRAGSATRDRSGLTPILLI